MLVPACAVPRSGESFVEMRAATRNMTDSADPRVWSHTQDSHAPTALVKFIPVFENIGKRVFPQPRGVFLLRTPNWWKIGTGSRYSIVPNAYSLSFYPLEVLIT